MIRAILVVAAKDLVLLLRDRAALFWVFAVPLLVAIPLGGILGGGLHALAPLAVQVLDQDETAASRGFLASLESTQGLTLRRAQSVEAGESEVRARRAAAVLVLRQGLEKVLSTRGPSASLPEGAVIELRADPQRRAEIAMLRGLVADAALANLVLPQPLEILPSLKTAAGMPGLPRVQVVPVEDALLHPPTPYARSFPAGMAWALIGATATFALALAREGWGETRLRLGAAPIAAVVPALGKAVACLVALSLSLVVLLAIGAVGFGLRPTGAAGLGLAYGAVAIATLGLMVLFSQAGRNAMAVSGTAWGVLLALALLGGAILPVPALPEWMQGVGQASPLRWAMSVLEGVLWRGQDVSQLWRPAVGLAGLGIVAFALGLFLLLGRRR